MNKFESKQVQSAKVLFENGLKEYAATTLAYLTRITKKQSTRNEIISLINELKLDQFLQTVNGVLIPKSF